MPLKTAVQEKRRFVRLPQPTDLGVRLVRSVGPAEVDSVNVSAGGLCLRLSEPLEIHSRVNLRLSREGSVPRLDKSGVPCTGRVAWVMQRLDLRGDPPFLFDVGIEFIDPPAVVRQWLMPDGVEAAPRPRAGQHRKALEPFTVKQRSFVPKLARESRQAPAPSGTGDSWHLVVSVDGAPCFSGHYATERAALEALTKFRRRQARSRGG